MFVRALRNSTEDEVAKKKSRKKGGAFHPVIDMLSKAAAELAPIVEIAESMGIRFVKATHLNGYFQLSPAFSASDVRALALYAMIEEGRETNDVRYGVHLEYHEATWQHRLVYEVRLSRRLSERGAWKLHCWSGAGTPHVDGGTKESLKRLGAIPGRGVVISASKAKKVAHGILEEYRKRVIVPRLLIPPVALSP